jgi:hypothetical protein
LAAINFNFLRMHLAISKSDDVLLGIKSDKRLCNPVDFQLKFALIPKGLKLNSPA